MGMKTEVDQVFLATVQSQNIAQVVYPNTNAGVNVVSDGAAAANAWSAYVQMVAAATIANPCWIVGILLGVVAVEAFQGQIEIAQGGAGAEVPIGIVGAGTNTFAVVEWFNHIAYLATPIRVAGSPRLACRIRKSTAASAAGHNTCNIVALTGVGT